MATRGQHFGRHARAVTSSVRILHLASRPKERSGAIKSVYTWTTAYRTETLLAKISKSEMLRDIKK